MKALGRISSLVQSGSRLRQSPIWLANASTCFARAARVEGQVHQYPGCSRDCTISQPSAPGRTYCVVLEPGLESEDLSAIVLKSSWANSRTVSIVSQKLP